MRSLKTKWICSIRKQEFMTMVNFEISILVISAVFKVDDDSDDDIEWSPSLHDEEVLEENVVESSNSLTEKENND